MIEPYRIGVTIAFDRGISRGAAAIRPDLQESKAVLDVAELAVGGRTDGWFPAAKAASKIVSRSVDDPKTSRLGDAVWHDEAIPDVASQFMHNYGDVSPGGSKDAWSPMNIGRFRVDEFVPCGPLAMQERNAGTPIKVRSDRNPRTGSDYNDILSILTNPSGEHRVAVHAARRVAA